MLQKETFLKQFLVVLLCLFLLDQTNATVDERKIGSVKKELKLPVVGVDQLVTDSVQTSLANISHNLTDKSLTPSSKPTTTLDSSHFVDVPKIRYRNDSEIPESYKTGFYIFIGLSVVAVLFIVLKVYGLRLSRAERKYGVQRDRCTQELTPLPISIEDDDSENDDHTVFELNREIRVM